MAEGGNQSTDVEPTCAPCGVENIKEKAVKYCPECQEYLCDTCSKHHGNLRLTRYHELLDISDAKDALVVAMPAKCRYHPDCDIEMHCGTHDMVYCTKCIATEHRTCSDVKMVVKISQTDTLQTEIKGLQDEGTRIIKSLEEINKEKRRNIDSLEKDCEKIQEDIKHSGEKLKGHIDNLTTKISGTLKSNFAETKKKLGLEEDLIAITINETEKITNQLQSVPRSNVAHQFIYMNLAKKSIIEATKVKEENEAKGTQVLKFNENIDYNKAILAGKDLGAVVVMSMNQKFGVPKEFNIKHRRSINVKIESDRNTCYITGVCQLPDGTVMLTDYYNCKIKRLGGNFSARDHCTLDSYPTDICCTGQNEVAVKMYNNKVQFLTVGECLSKARDITIEGGRYCGIVNVDKELWVSTGSGVNVYSGEGELQKTIVKDILGQNIFKKGVQRMALGEDFVIVTDGSNGAICLGKDGKVKKELQDQRLSKTNGACVSSDKIVFLSGNSSHNIIYFSIDGKSRGELTKKNVGITYPGSMCYDIGLNSIILASETSTDFIYILEISH